MSTQQPEPDRTRQIIGTTGNVLRTWGTAFVTSMVIGGYVFLGAILILALPKETRAPQIDLLIVLGVTMLTVIAASALTSLMFSLLTSQSPRTTQGEVFRESIKRFAWLASPIAAGYGLSQIVKEIAEILKQPITGG